MPTNRKWKLTATATGFEPRQEVDATPDDYTEIKDGHAYGTLSLANWGVVFGDGHRVRTFYTDINGSLEGYYNSTLGGEKPCVVLLLRSTIFLPTGVLDRNIKLPCHIAYREDKGWQWRVLKQSPHEGGKNLLRVFVSALSDKISKDSPYLVFPDLDRLRTKSATFSGCEDKDLGWVPVNTTSLTLETDGGWLGLRTPLGGARILVDKLIFDPKNDAPEISIIEGKGLDPNIPGMRITFIIPEDKTQPLEIASIDSTETDEPLQMEPYWVVPSSQQDAPNEHPESSGDDSSLWVGSDDGWLHVENPEPSPELAEEARRWDVGSALDLGDNPALSLYALMDQSGSKRLTMKFDNSGNISGLILEIESPVFEIESSALRMRRGADLKCPSFPPGPTPKGESLRLLATAKKDGALQLSKEAGSAVKVAYTSKDDNATLWTRPAYPLVGPEDWAANDPHSNETASSLRTLIPLKVPCKINLQESKPAWEVDNPVPDNVTFPKWAVGQVLLPILQGAHSEQRLEWLIASTKQLSEHIRYANPHQDAGFRWSVPPAKEGEQPVPVPTKWTRVRGGYFEPPAPRSIPAEALLSVGTLLNNAPLPEIIGKTDQSTSIVTVEGSLFRRIRLVQQGNTVRASVVLEKQLKEHLKAWQLDWLPLAYEDDKAIPLQVVAIDDQNQPVTIHPALDGQVMRIPTNPTDPIKMGGAVALPADWLCHHVFNEKAPNEFIGFESRDVSLSVEPENLLFELKHIIYWFALDGVVFPVKSEDQVRLDLKEDATPKVALKGVDEENQPLITKVMDAEKPKSYIFKKRHFIAPGLTVDEKITLFLEDSADRELVFRRHSHTDAPLENLIGAADGESLLLAVKAYGAQQSTQAVCQTGVYYVAWAAECKAGDIKADLPGSGLKLGALTRLFLRLERDGKTGSLNAKEGMVGWRCPEVPGGYINSRLARVTFYAHGDGKWDTVRLSGVWEKGNNSIALWRHPFLVEWSQGSESVTVKDQESKRQQWAITGRNAGNKTVYAFQKVEWGKDRLNFKGRVSTWKTTADKAGDPSIHVRPSLKVTVADAYQVRWGLKTTALHEWIPPITFQEDCPNWKHSFLPPESMHADENASDWSADSENYATTASKHGELLCPITKVEEPRNDWNERGPRIWVFTDREGEEMALPAGLVGAAVGSKPEKLRHTAEQILAHMSWRKPAILETWNENGRPNWELVDPPLLNIFGSLDYFTKSADIGLTTSVQRDASLVPYISDLIPAEFSPPAVETIVSAKNDESAIPTLAADISREKDSTASTGVIRRYTPFEVGGIGPLLFQGTAWPYWPEANDEGSMAVSALGQTSLFMGCPRPGEIQGHSVEEVLLPTDLKPARHTALMGWEARAPRSKVEHTIGVYGDTHRGIRWWMEMKVPRTSPQTGEQPSVVAVAGQPGKMAFKLGEWWAVGWRISSVENEEGPKNRLVVCIEGKPDSTDPGTVELHIKDGDKSHAFNLDVNHTSVVLPVASREKPLLMRIHSAKPQKTNWTVSFKAWSDPANPASEGYQQLPGEPDPAFDDSGMRRLPDPFQVTGQNDETSFIGKTPYLVGILSGQRLLAYGPWKCEPLPFFPEDTMEIQWRAEGAWDGLIEGNNLKIWCMSPDGAEHWGKKS